MESLKEEFLSRVDALAFFPHQENITLPTRAFATQKLDRWLFGTHSSAMSQIVFLGIKPEFRNLGILALLVAELVEHLLPRHYVECDASFILEDNNVATIKAINIFGGNYYI